MSNIDIHILVATRRMAPDRAAELIMERRRKARPWWVRLIIALLGGP